MFGLGPGKIDLKLDKTNFKRGETITGKLTLTLNKPVKAKALLVQFYGTQPTGRPVSRTGVMGVPVRQRREERVIYSFDLNLDSEKEYSQGTKEYSFEIKIPRDLPQKPKVEGEGAMKGMARFMLSIAVPSINWFVKGKLDIPLAADITKAVQITIE